MKRLILLCVLASFIDASEFKLYDVKSGKVTYDIKGSGNIMGAKQKMVGKKRLIFDKYGYRELNEESTVSSTNVFGNIQKDKSHKITLRVGDKAKVADFNQKTIYESTLPMMSMISAQRDKGDKDFVGMGEQMLKEMGGKKVGTDTVAGYKCDIWKMELVTQCLYKGVPLKIESNVMGIKQITKAVDAKFDIDIDESSFKLPDFKTQKNPLPNSGVAIDSKDMANMMKGLNNISSNSNSKNQNSDIATMVGNALLPQMKKEFLSQESTMKFAKSCLEKSDTLKEANECEKMISKRLDEPSEPFKKWDKKTKEQTLKDIQKGLDSMGCIKKANTITEIQKCEE